MSQQVEGVEPAPPEDGRTSELPFSILLELNVTDPEVVAELNTYPEGPPRDEFAIGALRVGVLALRQARGSVDADLVQRECERMLTELRHRLGEHSKDIHDNLTNRLKEYFDPTSGRFQERVERLVKKDGELESVLRRQVGAEDSELCRTLTAHIGETSPLMKLLSPTESEGLQAAMSETLAEQLKLQRDGVLKEFSLDNKEGALARLVSELTQSHGKLSEELQEKIDEVVKEFSLDEENSALSRLVRNVDRAQKTIASEFSLDNESSALSRITKILETTNTAITSQLTLDDEDSALARLKRELLTILKDHSKTNREFQDEVKMALNTLVAKRQEAERSTRHGVVFEDAVFEFLQRGAQSAGDIASATGNTTGLIKNCKVGDCVIELGPDSAAPGAKIAVEAKEEAGYPLEKARVEIETARKNRDGQVGLFVFSKKSSPAALDPVARYGDDVFVVWDADDVQSDLFLRVGATLAKALCVRRVRQRESQEADFAAINDAILEIEKRTSALSDISTWAKTIKTGSEKILKRVETTRKSLEKQSAILQEKIEDFSASLTELSGTSD